MRLTARHLPEAPGAHLLKTSVCGVFRAWVFMLLPQTSRDSAPFPTAKRTSSPAGFWAWILGRESQSWELTKVFILIMFPFILGFFFFFCHLLFYSQSYVWPGQFISFFNHWVLCLFELFFKAGLASLWREIESFQFCPCLNLVSPHPRPEGVGRCVPLETTFSPLWVGGRRAATSPWLRMLLWQPCLPPP